MHSCVWTQGQEKYAKWKTKMTSLVHQSSSEISLSNSKPPFAKHVSFLPEAQLEPEENIHSINSMGTLKSLSIIFMFWGECMGGGEKTKCKLKKNFKNPLK